MNEPVYEKLLRWCTYRDRCISEVRLKCKELGLDTNQTEKIISRLIDENFLNELRFAKQYVLSKCTLKKWGKQKIRFELTRKKVDSDIIEQALADIEDEDYMQILYKTAEKKWNSLKEPHPGKKKLKLQAYLHQKGYTGEDIREVIKQLDKK
jgi:regulatory protein